MITKELSINLIRMLSGKDNQNSCPLVVGKPSKILSECGANREYDITVTKKVIDKAMRAEVRDAKGRMIGNTGHGLSVDHIVRSIQELDSPTFVFKGRQTGSLLVVTSVKDCNKRNIVIAIKLNKQEGFSMVNSIRSIYGRDRMAYFIETNMENGNLLAANKEKADELLHSIGKSYPEENTFISFH